MIANVSFSVRSGFSRRLFPCRAAADVKPKQPVPDKSTTPAPKTSPQVPLQPHLHIIEHSKWPDGIPAIQGAHLMASGSVAPISTSKGVLRECQHIFKYFPEPYVCSIREYPGQTTAGEALSEMILAAARSSIEAKGLFTLAILGGSVISLLKSLVNKKAEFEKWHVFWVDERVVALDHEDSNFKAASDAFLTKLGIPKSNQHSIVENASAEETATHYEGILVKSGNYTKGFRGAITSECITSSIGVVDKLRDKS